MWKAALLGVVLAATGAPVVLAQDYETASYEASSHASRSPVITEGHIARLRAALHLTAEQRSHWPAVESALRALAHRQSKDRSTDGIARRLAAAAFANALRRVASAAGPLIDSLDEKQRQDGMRVIRSLGFGSLASAL
jgi:hypothetical protein